MSKSLAFLIGCESDVVMWGKRRGSCTVEGNAVEVNAMEVDAIELKAGSWMSSYLVTMTREKTK